MTNSELVLLSLIAEQPRHGYELEHVIVERGMRNWSEIAFSSIYFLLNKLVRDGLAAASTMPAQGRGPAKKVYTATQAGIIALIQGVRDSLSNPEPGSRAFMFGLSCLPLISKTDALKALQERQQALRARQQELVQHPALSQPGFPPHVKAMFTYSLPLIQAELDWLEKFIRDLKEGAFENGQN